MPKASKAKKAKDEIPYRSRRPIRHAYDEAISRTARLIAFAACPLLPEWGEIGERQEEMAIDDMVALAIHVRRLLENTGLQKPLGDGLMEGFVDGKMQPVRILRVINAIIHHRHLDMLRRRSDTLPIPDKKDKKGWATWLATRLTNQQDGIVPIAWVKSDREEFLGFRIDNLATAVALKIIAPVVEYCDDRGLYLEDMGID